MIEPNSGKWPSWIWQLAWPQWAPALVPSKNEFSMFSSTSVPNFMLVDKSAQYPPPPKKSLRAWTKYHSLERAYCCTKFICSCNIMKIDLNVYCEYDYLVNNCWRASFA